MKADYDIGKSFLGMKLQKIDNSMSKSSIPGYQALKDTIIKPIIVATEKMVE